MKTLRVLLTKAFFPEDLAYLRRGLSTAVELVVPSDYLPKTLAEAVKADIDVLFGELVTLAILQNARHLKLVQVPWTGVDRMDFALLREFGVTVCNSHSNARAVAEMAVGLLLAITKKIPLHDSRLRQGEWMRPKPGRPDSHYPPTLLGGKTALCVGYGAVARQVVTLLSGFGMRFIATEARLVSPAPQPLEALYAAKQLHEIIPQADILFITIPLLPSTRGLIDAQAFNLMRSTAYLINTSRGEVIDEAALFDVLKARHIAGAAIDTWYQYPKAGQPNVLPSAQFPFHELENLVLSPHRAGFADGELPHLADAVHNLNRLAAGQSLINHVDIHAGF